MKTTDHFKRTIQAYLEQRAAEDKLFAVAYRKEDKNIDDCVTYILNEVQRSGCNGFTDGEVYSMAVHYYDEDDIEVGNPLSCQVMVNHTVELTEEEQRLLGRTVKSAKRGRGCEHCLNTGYKGRTAVHEIFVMDRELKRMTAENRPAWEIEEYIVKTQGMRTMREELADLVCDGVIPMEEFLRMEEVR